VIAVAVISLILAEALDAQQLIVIGSASLSCFVEYCLHSSSTQNLVLEAQHLKPQPIWWFEVKMAHQICHRILLFFLSLGKNSSLQSF